MSDHQLDGSSSGRRILIVGSAGQLGVELQKSFAGAGTITAVDLPTVDITNAPQFRAFIRETNPDVILNAAAYTDVDRAESQPELAHAVNAEAPRIMAEESRRLNALLVHYSTDYVFDGSKTGPWVETDTPNPLSMYGASKLAGEQAVESVGGKTLIFRTSWVYGSHGKNFLLTMLRLGQERDQLSIVDDQIGAPTTSSELAAATHSIVSGILGGKFGDSASWAGLYHMTCSGSTSWFGFAEAIFTRASQLMGAKAPELTPILTSAYPTPATRPHNSVLSNEKLKTRFGVALASWESALDDVFDALIEKQKN
ncbi:MAG: dTDP-4-dehydrorhamnose reductase [Terracidiphilus sp.]